MVWIDGSNIYGREEGHLNEWSGFPFRVRSVSLLVGEKKKKKRRLVGWTNDWWLAVFLFFCFFLLAIIGFLVCCCRPFFALECRVTYGGWCVLWIVELRFSMLRERVNACFIRAELILRRPHRKCRERRKALELYYSARGRRKKEVGLLFSPRRGSYALCVLLGIQMLLVEEGRK